MLRLLMLLCVSSSAVMPGDSETAPSTSGCNATECVKPAKHYQRVFNSQPGSQWNDAGGYCGSWSIQRAAMVKGAWISQQQVRDHTVRGGGNDNEILHTNIDLALKNLKLKGEGFDFATLPTPQADAYRKWIKSKLAIGHPIVALIMTNHGKPVDLLYNMSYGYYTHVEPIVGILSDHPLSDPMWYDDDYIAHYTDHDNNLYYRSMASLPDDTNFSGNCAEAHYSSMPCFYYQYGFGWAVEGLADEREALPVSLTVSPWEFEPDVRRGDAPQPLTGTLTIEGLIVDQQYVIYRWDSVEAAFDYEIPSFAYRFTASASSETWTDPKTFSSDGTTYYRCVPDGEVRFRSYPGYSGPLQVTGWALVYMVPDGAAVGLQWSLAGAEADKCATVPEGVANACAIHIHSGTGCDDDSQVGGHYYDADAFPWAGVAYTTLNDGRAIGNAQVAIGNVDIADTVLVVHDSTGARVACGVSLAQVGNSCIGLRCHPLMLMVALAVSGLAVLASVSVLLVRKRRRVDIGLLATSLQPISCKVSAASICKPTEPIARDVEYN